MDKTDSDRNISRAAYNENDHNDDLICKRNRYNNNNEFIRNHFTEP